MTDRFPPGPSNWAMIRTVLAVGALLALSVLFIPFNLIFREKKRID